MAKYDDAAVQLQLAPDSSTAKIRLRFSEEPDFSLAFDSRIDGSTDIDPYIGPYEVTPSVREQSLPTEGKRMSENVRVHSIPFYEVENIQRGMTAIIGGD